MKTLKISEIVEAVGGVLLSGNMEDTVKNVSTNSGETKVGDIFFALVGVRHDAHTFVSQVVDNGCKAVVVSDKDSIVHDRNVAFILVENTLTAYQELARYYRELISPITIGITGSVGKTSLKEMVKTIACDNFNTVYSLDNENNHIGVPKTIFKLEENTEVLVLEMGMNHKGEISRLVQIGKPDIGAITNVGVSHIGNFSDRDGLFHAKMEITDLFTSQNTLVVYGDDEYLSTLKGDLGYNLIRAGESQTNDYIVSKAKSVDKSHITFLIEYDNGIERFTLPVAGLYNKINAALAVAIMSKLNIGVSACAHSLQNLEISGHRLKLIEKDGLTIINDAYNASPDSMKSGIDYLVSLDIDRRIAVLGDMGELGDKSEVLHRQVGDYVADKGVDLLFTVGEWAEFIADSAEKKMGLDKVLKFKDKESCVAALMITVKKGDGILVKGSNSMKMAEVANAF